MNNKTMKYYNYDHIVVTKIKIKRLTKPYEKLVITVKEEN